MFVYNYLYALIKKRYCCIKFSAVTMYIVYLFWIIFLPIISEIFNMYTVWNGKILPLEYLNGRKL